MLAAPHVGGNGQYRSVECANSPPQSDHSRSTQNQSSVQVRVAGFADATEPATSGALRPLESRAPAWPSFLRKRDPVPSPQRRDTGSAVLVCGWPTFRGVRANPEGRPSSETTSAFSGIRPPSDPAACASGSRRQATAGPNRTYQASRVRARWSCRRPHWMHRASEIGRSRSCSCPACN